MAQDERYRENAGVLTSREQALIADLRIMVVGLGGIGGHVAEALARLGVRSLSLVDYDVFSDSNLNRQLFCRIADLGRRKAEVVAMELAAIRPDLEIHISVRRVEELGPEAFEGVDVIVDAVDAIPTKVFLETVAAIRGKVLLHGAAGGWYGQVAVLPPGSTTLRDFYGRASSGMERDLRSPTFTPRLVAAAMVCELVKHVAGRSEATTGRILSIDLLHHEWRLLGGGDGSW